MAKTLKSMLGKKGKKVDGKELRKDGNKEERRSRKTKWKAFNDAIRKNNQSGQLEIYGGLSVALKGKFRDAWEKDPGWQFVEQFKSRSVKKVNKSIERAAWKSAVWLKRELGSKGAKRVIKLALKEGKVKKDRAGNRSYQYCEDFEAGGAMSV